MNKNSKQIVLSLVFLALAFAAVFGLSDFLAKTRPPLPKNYEDDDLALQGAKLKNYSLGFNGLIADWYWMQSLQYVGNKILSAEGDVINLDNLSTLNPRLLYPLLDNATDLDPRFVPAYQYGAVVLPAINSEEAIKITEKGIANNPQEWRLFHHLGYIYWRLGNYEKAAEVYERGAKIGGAPPFMQIMVARLKTQGGSRETARAIYQEMLRQSQDQKTRENAESRLLELDSLDERDAVRKVLADFRQKTGRCPNNFSEIFSQLRTVRLPEGKDFRVDNSNNLIDPAGTPYLLDKEICDILLDETKTKIPLR